MSFFRRNVKELEERRDVKGLINRLEDKDPAVRKEAADSLFRLRYVKALTPLNEQRMVEIMKRVFGEEHPDTLTAMNGLGETMVRQGENDKARELFELVLARRRRILGEDHPDTLQSMGNRALAWGLPGVGKEVVEAMTRVHGAEHRDTLKAMDNLAMMLGVNGNVVEARRLSERVLEVRVRVFGEEDPDTLTTMGNIGSALQEQGHWSEAERLQRRLLEVMTRVNGLEHPETSITAWNLAGTLESMGDTIGARKVLKESLSWVFDRDPRTLPAVQQNIRQQMLGVLGGNRL